MGIKTIKLKADEYFTLDTVKPLPYFLIGGRGTGKSYFVKNYVKKVLLDSEFDRKYIYVRINKNELPTHDSWLLESGITEEFQQEADNVTIKRGKPFGGAVSLQYTLPTGLEREHIGYVASLETSALIKSSVFADVDVIVFEEFLRRGMTEQAIHNYCVNFMELVESVARERSIPIFFIANTLSAYNPLLSAFKNFEVIKIFSEPRRKNVADGAFAKYLQGEQLQEYDYNLEDFDYLFTLKFDKKPMSFYADRFTHRDIVVTAANSTRRERLDIVYALQREFLYSFSTLKFMFDSDKTEVFFYTNIDKVKLKIRNKLTTLLNL